MKFQLTTFHFSILFFYYFIRNQMENLILLDYGCDPIICLLLMTTMRSRGFHVIKCIMWSALNDNEKWMMTRQSVEETQWQNIHNKCTFFPGVYWNLGKVLVFVEDRRKNKGESWQKRVRKQKGFWSMFYFIFLMMAMITMIVKELSGNSQWRETGTFRDIRRKKIHSKFVGV